MADINVHLSSMHDSPKNLLYLHLVKHEHHYAILGVSLLALTLLFNVTIVFSLFAITVLILWGLNISTESIGFSDGYFSNLPSITIRFCTVSFLTTVFILYYPFHAIPPLHILYLVLIIMWFVGYFIAFMRRKNFSAWISLLFPSALLTAALFFSDIALNSDIINIFTLSILASTVRLATNNVLDAVSVFMIGLLLRFSILI